jgi:hypothetical protein
MYIYWTAYPILVLSQPKVMASYGSEGSRDPRLGILNLVLVVSLNMSKLLVKLVNK